MRHQQLLSSIFLALFISLSQLITAQESSVFFMVDYMKVTEGMTSEYLAGEQGVWKSVHQGFVKSGLHHGWSLHQVIVPSGSAKEYDYVTVTRFNGEKALANYMSGAWYDDVVKTLSDEQKAAMQQTEKARKRLRMDIFQYEGGVFSEGNDSPPKYSVVNYIKLKEGISASEYTSVEHDIWKPMHEARIKDGKMRSWFMTSRQLPFGSSMEYQRGTVDQYDSLEDMMSADIPSYFSKVHAGKDANKALQRTSSSRDIIRGDVLELIDSTQD